MISKEDQKELDALHKQLEGVELPEIEEVKPEPMQIEELSGAGGLRVALERSGSTPQGAFQDAQILLLETLVEQMAEANTHLQEMARVIGGNG